MRYWLLVILIDVLFYFIVKHVAPEWYDSTADYYTGQIICTLIAAVITWRDPPDQMESCSAL